MIQLDYELLDSGDGYRLERFGNNIVARPDSTIIWRPRSPRSNWNFDAILVNSRWQTKKSFKEKWIVSCDDFSLGLKLGRSPNIGVFPEQLENWKWINKVIKGSNKQPEILNLFGYTGGSTLAAAVSGAKVTHVDSAKSIISWFLSNKILSNLDTLPMRYIVEDCIKFVNRELRRGNRYDAIILDPPAFGKGSSGEVFKFEKDVPVLLELCKKILKPKPLFVLLNSYSMGYSPYVIGNLLEDFFPNQEIECGDLLLEEVKRERVLQCGVFARFKVS
ncbi:class I SAM-dependent methyltransferase [Candidatus Babeliales bacterium]|nr:class I SAM-dependent methyltransferase [Candidatus Babeliales bacterium]